MDQEKFDAITREDLPNLTDEELDAIIDFADRTVNYNQNMEFAESLRGLGIEAGTALVTGGLSLEARAAFSMLSTLHGTVSDNDDVLAQDQTAHAKNLKSQAEFLLGFRENQYPYAGPNDGIASQYDGNQDNDTSNPDYTLEDARRDASRNIWGDANPSGHDSDHPGYSLETGDGGDDRGSLGGGDGDSDNGGGLTSSDRPSSRPDGLGDSDGSGSNFGGDHDGDGGGLTSSDRPADRPDGLGDSDNDSDYGGGSHPGHGGMTGDRTPDTSYDGDHDVGVPLVLDLDGDGVEINVTKNVSFDMDGDGYREQTAWADADDGFLVVDLDGNGRMSGAGDGRISQTKELVLPSLLGRDDITDLQALKIMESQSRYGGNNDGVLNARDPLWQRLKVWQDRDQNGEVDRGEMKTLDQVGIRQINLRYDDGTGFGDKSNDTTAFGSTLLGEASYTRTNGEIVEGGVGDVGLSYREQGWKIVQTAIGHDVLIEGRERLSFAVLDGRKSPHINLDDAVLDGAIGDDRGNSLNAVDHTRSVQIAGGAGNDTIEGGVNNDLLHGGAGADALQGGQGNDTIHFDAADLDSGKLTGDEGYDTGCVTGSDAVHMKLANHDLEAVHGGGGNDRLDGRGLGENLQISGGDGHDSIYGGESDDILHGDANADVIEAGSGDDYLSGGVGHDTLSGKAGSDFLLGGDGWDQLEGGSGDDALSGGADNDRLHGGEADDRLYGGAGDDRLDGGSGDDVVKGGDGRDRLSFWHGDDTLVGGRDNDIFAMERGGLDFGFDGWSIVQGGRGYDVLTLAGSRNDWDIEKVSDEANQWKLVRRDGGNTMVIDAQDVEQVRFSETETFLGKESAKTITLSTDTGRDSSGHYVRRSWDAPYGDDLLNPRGADDVLSGDIGNDHLTGTWTRHTNSSGGSETREYSYNGRLQGDSGADRIAASQLGNHIKGGSGADSLIGGVRRDRLDGEAGSDRIFGGADNDIITGGAGTDVLAGESGADSIRGSDGSDVLSGGYGNDTLRGDSGADLVHGNDGDDYLSGWTGADRLFGDRGRDQLLGEAGSDALDGGDDNDTLDGGDGFDVLAGGNGNDWLSGGNDDDLLSGAVGNDNLKGDAGNDTLIGGAGADTLAGGPGSLDMISYEKSTARVVIDLAANTARGGDAEGDRLSGIEQVTGSDHDDILNGARNDNVLIGGKGNDTIYGHDDHDDLTGGDGNDRLNGGAGADRIQGEAGNDTIVGPWGADTIYGGNGRDVIDFSGNGRSVTIDLISNRHGGIARGQLYYQIDDIIGSQADDRILGNNNAGNELRGVNGHDVLSGRDGNDTLRGGNGNDTLQGGTGADYFDGGAGTDLADYLADYHAPQAGVTADLGDVSRNTGIARGDTYRSIEKLRGTAYNDELRGDNAANGIWGNSGNDRVYGRDGNDRIFGQTGNDFLNGQDGDDALYGGTGNDTFHGGVGNDTLQGEAGNDIVIGHEGSDILGGGDHDDDLYGGSGNDHLIGGSGNDTIRGEAGADRLNGSSGTDLASYYLSDTGVTADLLSSANNARGAAGDTLISIENLYGSKFGDDLRGNGGDNILWGDSGNDKLWGRDGDDALYAGAGNDTLYGQVGNDRLHGENGNDMLLGGTGNDTLNGGGGSDVFIFGRNGDRDRVKTFENNLDTIRFDANLGIESFAEVRQFATQNGEDVIFDFGNGDRLIVEGITINALQDDMIFG